MANQPRRTSPHDTTGQQVQRQQEEAKKAEAEKAKAEAERVAAEKAEKEKVVNLTEITYEDEDENENENDSQNIEEVGGIVDLGTQEVETQTRVIRVNETISPTIGAGNEYHFEEGRKYRVPVHVAQHLDEKGYVWH